MLRHWKYFRRKMAAFIQNTAVYAETNYCDIDFQENRRK
jgi:hypothetical protein